MLFILPLLAAVCSGTTPLINGQYYNLTSYSGLYNAVNNSCAGAVGWAIAIVFFVIIFFGATSYSEDPALGIAVAGAVMAMGSLALQFIGINTSVMPLLFGGCVLLGVAVAGLRYILSPYK